MTDLVADKPVELVWNSIDGKYIGEGLYAEIGPKFTGKEITILEGIADAAGKWAGKFNVPEGFCGDFTLWVKQMVVKLCPGAMYGLDKSSIKPFRRLSLKGLLPLTFCIKAPEAP